VHSRSRFEVSLLVAMALGLLASGCARAVLPSEKAYLADPIMQLDVDALEVASDAHIQDNREGASGGRGTQGGGCGCN
jgi:hypothetical protein